MAFIGLMIAPMVGIQIADWYFLRRRESLRVSSLYRHDPTSHYWYFRGFNPAGIIALATGSVLYQLLLNPVTYEPRLSVFKYLTASLPSVVVAAVVYTVLSRVWRGRMHRRAHNGGEPATLDQEPHVSQRTRA